MTEEGFCSMEGGRLLRKGGICSLVVCSLSAWCVISSPVELTARSRTGILLEDLAMPSASWRTLAVMCGSLEVLMPGRSSSAACMARLKVISVTHEQ
jgi:hypothetical protein